MATEQPAGGVMWPDTVWELGSLTSLGGQTPEVLGAPQVVATASGPAILFDGRQDGIIAPVLPLAGAAQFTIEMVFCPTVGGEREQRVLHVQTDGTENRALIETRVAGPGHWFVDTFMRSGEESQTLYAEHLLHPFGSWYHVALVYDGVEMRHYVDRQLEMAGALSFAPLGQGRTALGVRLNRVSWFQGMIRVVSFARLALEPESFRLWA